MELHIDRSLPIALSEQIKGQITYAIMCGNLGPGQALPSVRRLAQSLGVSSVTVNQVYRELFHEKLIVTKPGSGTFVADLGDTHLSQGLENVQKGLSRIVDVALRQALALGYTADEIREEFLAHLDHCSREAAPQHVVLVGNFRAATDYYACEIESILHDLNVRVHPILLDELKAHSNGVVEALSEAKLVITIPTRLVEVQRLLESWAIRVVAAAFQVSSGTRYRLSLIPPTHRLGVVATYPEFLQSLLNEVSAYCLVHKPPLFAVLDQDELIKQMLSNIDVLVYATGSERVREWLPEGVEAIECTYVPEPDSINRLRPLLLL